MSKIIDLYYKIWVDCLVRLRSQDKNKSDWREKGMIMITIAMTFNFMLFMAILERGMLGCYFYKLSFPSLSDRFNNVLSILVLHFLPIAIINYLLIFRKRRYWKLIKKYPYYNGKLAVPYFTISLLLPVILLFVYIIATQDVTFWSFFGK